MRRAQRAANLRRLIRASPRVQVEIDELVLHGFAASERYAIGDALSLELGRLFGEADLRRAFRRGMELPELNVGRVTLTAQAGPAAAGAQVGRAVYSGLSAGDKGKK
jgi:hypothetical protein